MTIKPEDKAKIKIPVSIYGDQIFLDIVAAIEKDPGLTTQAFVRGLVAKNKIKKDDEVKVGAVLGNFRGKYIFLNKVSGKERLVESNKYKGGNITPIGERGFDESRKFFFSKRPSDKRLK